MGIFWIFYACWLFDFFRSHFVWSFAAPLRQGLWFQCGSRVGPGPSMHFQMEALFEALCSRCSWKRRRLAESASQAVASSSCMFRFAEI